MILTVDVPREVVETARNRMARRTRQTPLASRRRRDHRCGRPLRPNTPASARRGSRRGLEADVQRRGRGMVGRASNASVSGDTKGIRSRAQTPAGALRAAAHHVHHAGRRGCPCGGQESSSQGLVAAPNPVSALDGVERPNTDDSKPKRILNADELFRLIAAVSPRHRLIFRLAAETGCRLAEVLGLAWQDIDED